MMNIEKWIVQKEKATLSCDFFFLAESKGFEPSNGFWPLHDFQSCSLDQLGQLSVLRLVIIQKSKWKINPKIKKILFAP